jgi:chaperonin cofactor prefoldin
MSDDTRDARWEQRFDTLEARFDTLETRFDALETRFDGLEARVQTIEVRMDRIERRMDKVEIRLEAVEDAIKLLAEAHAATQALIERRFQDIVDYVTMHTAPLDLLVREHSAIVRHHNLTMGSDHA